MVGCPGLSISKLEVSVSAFSTSHIYTLLGNRFSETWPMTFRLTFFPWHLPSNISPRTFHPWNFTPDVSSLKFLSLTFRLCNFVRTFHAWRVTSDITPPNISSSCIWPLTFHSGNLTPDISPLIFLVSEQVTKWVGEWSYERPNEGISDFYIRINIHPYTPNSIR